MQYLKVFDKISNHERHVTQKAFDIITKNKRNPRYKFIEYVDADGQALNTDQPAPQVFEKKTEPLTEPSQKAVEPVAAEGITVIRKKPGPKPKVHAQE